MISEKKLPGLRTAADTELYKECIKLVKEKTGLDVEINHPKEVFEKASNERVFFNLKEELSKKTMFSFFTSNINLCGVTVIYSLDSRFIWSSNDFTEKVKEALIIMLEHFFYNRCVFNFQGDTKYIDFLKKLGFEEVDSYYNPYHYTGKKTELPTETNPGKRDRLVLKFQTKYYD